LCVRNVHCHPSSSWGKETTRKTVNKQLVSPSRECSSTPAGFCQGFLGKEQCDNTGASPILSWLTNVYEFNRFLFYCDFNGILLLLLILPLILLQLPLLLLLLLLLLLQFYCNFNGILLLLILPLLLLLPLLLVPLLLLQLSCHSVAVVLTHVRTSGEQVDVQAAQSYDLPENDQELRPKHV